jgi:phosphoglycerate dehydrogenase-like enzyme
LPARREVLRGDFNQRSSNKMLRGVCGILGFGNVGIATARLMRAFGMQIPAINRRGASAEPTDWIATTARLDEMLRAADVFVVCAALTTETAGLIGARGSAIRHGRPAIVPSASAVGCGEWERCQPRPL